jgi:hypothetical protein
MSGGHKPGKVFKATVLSVSGFTAVLEVEEGEDIEYLAGIIGVESVFHVTATGAGGKPGGDKPSTD